MFAPWPLSRVETMKRKEERGGKRGIGRPNIPACEFKTKQARAHVSVQINDATMEKQISGEFCPSSLPLTLKEKEEINRHRQQS